MKEKNPFTLILIKFFFRPDWDKCSPLITHWQNLSLGKTSEQLVDVVINEIVHGNTEENNDEYFPMNITELTHKNTFFHQLSIDSSFENKLIKNRHMRRRITGLLIKEIWSKKLSAANKVCILPPLRNKRISI